MSTSFRSEFQFHIGTIKSELNSAAQLPRDVFQFHIGTIKRLKSNKSKNFNSILVRLKVGWARECYQASCWFQFHIGTIKSRCAIPCTTLLPKFQFHIGTIKSDVALTPQPYYYEFQFHIGTIKRCDNLLTSATDKVFQFHIGTIKRVLSLAASEQVRHFNSILVRLKGCRARDCTRHCC